MNLIEAHGLVKTFGSVRAVNGVDLSIPGGQIYGLVGADGAGKTTTLRLLAGALRPDEGECFIGGYNVAHQTEQARSLIGYLSQRFSMYEDLTVLENIRFFAEVRNLDHKTWLPRCLEILDFVGLAPFKDRLARQLSGGMKQKLGLASALVSQPRVLLLDEPTTGVDPMTRQDFWQLIIRIAVKEQLAVLLTTPYMDEASRCSSLSFMRSGKIIAQGSPQELRRRLDGRIIELHTHLPLQTRQLATQLPGVEDVRAYGEKIHIRTQTGKSDIVLENLRKALPPEAGTAGSLRIIPATLEDVFISLINEES